MRSEFIGLLAAHRVCAFDPSGARRDSDAVPTGHNNLSTVLETLFGPPPQFDPAHDGVDYAVVERWAPVLEALAAYFRPSYHGLEHIPPEGGALLVGNHGLCAFDGLFLGTAIYRATGRLPRGLAERMLFLVPGVRDSLQQIGSLDGTPDAALAFLRAGHLVNTYPGGAREALKPREMRYRLRWDKSFGFVRLALRAQVPVILHMGIGIDESWHIVGRIRWTGRVMGSDKYELPVLLGWGLAPRPVKFTYYLSKPIRLDGRPEDADDAQVVERIHRDLWDRGHAMLEEGLRRRRSVWFG
jgi:1-acyl-sn-glycerol-3-phosphate acyltransferase